MARLAAVVVLLEVAADISAVVDGLLDPSKLTVPGGVIRALLMGGLGYLFIVKRRRWARLSFAAIELVTGLTFLGFAVVAIQAGRTQLDATMVAVVCGYLTAGLIVMLSGKPSSGEPVLGVARDARK